MFSKTLFLLCLVGLLTPLLAYPLPVPDGKLTRCLFILCYPRCTFSFMITEVLLDVSPKTIGRKML